MNSSSISISKAALIGVACLVLVESYLGTFSDDQFTRIGLQRTAELEQQSAPLIEIFGDSVADGGINEVLLARELGLKQDELVNASIPGTHAYYAYFVLKRQIDAGHVPKNIILAYNARSYARAPGEKFLARFARWREMPTAVRHGIPFEDLARSVVARFSFSLRYRDELNAMIRTKGGGGFFDPQVTPAEDRAVRTARLPVLRPAPSRMASASGFNPGFHGGSFIPAAEITSSLRSFFELTQKHQIEVFLVSMPKTEEAKRRHNDNGFDAAYEGFMDNMAMQGGAHWLLREQLPLAADCFSDAVHLTPCAAFDFSLLLAEKMKISGMLQGIHDKH